MVTCCSGLDCVQTPCILCHCAFIQRRRAHERTDSTLSLQLTLSKHLSCSSFPLAIAFVMFSWSIDKNCTIHWLKAIILVASYVPRHCSALRWWSSKLLLCSRTSVYNTVSVKGRYFENQQILAGPRFFLLCAQEVPLPNLSKQWRFKLPPRWKKFEMSSALPTATASSRSCLSQMWVDQSSFPSSLPK